MTVRIEGLAELRERVERMRSRAQDLDPFLAAEAERLEEVIDEAWARRTSPAGEPWPPSEGDGGSLRTAHRVTGEGQELQIRVDHRAASFQFFGTSGEHANPARNPLPVERVGGGFERAPAFWDEHLARLKAYLLAETETA